jgi:hypothetical protein
VVGGGKDESVLLGAAAIAGRLLAAVERGELDAPDRLIRLLDAVRKAEETKR